MARFLSRDRFGAPQLAALLMLALFAAQCLWLMAASPMSPSQAALLQRGLAQWQQGRINVQDPYRSPLYYLLASLPIANQRGADDPAALQARRWQVRLPWLIFGLLLGASIWYVARRLYGNAGGYIALLLYCFSPLMIAEAASYYVQPEVTALWGAFGAIFTSIAVAHTLYAPRRVLWNWRRILLLGLSLALAIGSQFSLWVLLPMALAFLLYLAPGRRAAAVAIFAAGCVVAFVFLWAAYSFSLAALSAGLHRAAFWDVTWEALRVPFAYKELLVRLVRTSPALVIFAPGALITFAVWPRARYFGNAAPLIVAGSFLFLGLITPHLPGQGFELVAMPILFVFIAGVLADLLESKQRQIVLGIVVGLLAAYIVWSVTSLGRIGRL
ncbi:MAG TPA: glycosyltransferase family 39 protein [Terriglobales bacterium]|nr:glycosyltransferase family 39 protein [Terriglobales bacterium]